jgi:hypothetical protein
MIGRLPRTVPAQRDPVSVLMDRGAAALLERAYARPGVWVRTRLEAPSLRQQVWARARGIEPYADARGMERWPRAFVRSLYYLHKWYYWPGRGLERGRRRTAPDRAYALQVRVGARGYFRRQLGWPVAVRVRPGGPQAYAAVPAGRRYTDDPAIRSEVQQRDY